MAQPIKIGQLKDRITIQEASTAQNAYGEEVRTWGTLSGGEVYALVDWNNTGSGEIYSKEKLNATTSISFIIRHRTDVTPKMRILYKSNYYDIRVIKEIEYNKYILLQTILSDGNQWD